MSEGLKEMNELSRVFQPVKKYFNEFKESPNVIGWWKAILPSLLLVGLTNEFVGSFAGLALGILGYFLVGYLSKVRIDTYRQKKAVSLTEPIKNRNWTRDGAVGFFLDIWGAIPLLVTAWGYLLFIRGTTSLIAGLIAVGILCILVTLTYLLVVAPMMLTPYIIAEDQTISATEAMTLSYKTLFREDRLTDIMVYSIITILGVFLSLLLFGLPLIVVIPYLLHYKTGLMVSYLDSLDDSDYGDKVVDSDLEDGGVDVKSVNGEEDTLNDSALDTDSVEDDEPNQKDEIDNNENDKIQDEW